MPLALIRPSAPLIRPCSFCRRLASPGSIARKPVPAGFGPAGAADAGLSNDLAAQQCTPALLGEPAGPAGSRLRGCRNKHRAGADNRVEPAGHSPDLARDYRGRPGGRPGRRRRMGSPHREPLKPLDQGSALRTPTPPGCPKTKLPLKNIGHTASFGHPPAN